MKNILLLSILFFIGCATHNKSPKYPGIIKLPEVKEVVTRIDIEDGKYVYENVCNNCHKFYDAKSFTKIEWKNITKRMQDKTHLNDADIENVYQYIISTL